MGACLFLPFGIIRYNSVTARSKLLEAALKLLRLYRPAGSRQRKGRAPKIAHANEINFGGNIYKKCSSLNYCRLCSYSLDRLRNQPDKQPYSFAASRFSLASRERKCSKTEVLLKGNVKCVIIKLIVFAVRPLLECRREDFLGSYAVGHNRTLRHQLAIQPSANAAYVSFCKNTPTKRSHALKKRSSTAVGITLPQALEPVASFHQQNARCASPFFFRHAEFPQFRSSPSHPWTGR
jgi:hypothetical protein